MAADHVHNHSKPWNKGRPVGQKTPLKQKGIWAILVCTSSLIDSMKKFGIDRRAAFIDTLICAVEIPIL